MAPPARNKPSKTTEPALRSSAHQAFGKTNKSARTKKPIELHYWPTPNGWKITIMLEECGLPYKIKFVNILKGEQFAPDFLRIAPNNRMLGNRRP